MFLLPGFSLFIYHFSLLHKGSSFIQCLMEAMNHFFNEMQLLLESHFKKLQIVLDSGFCGTFIMEF